MEAAPFYEVLIKDGVSRESAVEYDLVSAAMNAMGFMGVFSKSPLRRFFGSIAKGMFVEGMTEWLEEPAHTVFEAIAKGETIKDGVDRVVKSLRNAE
jgi:hypothetical protein